MAPAGLPDKASVWLIDEDAVVRCEPPSKDAPQPAIITPSISAERTAQPVLLFAFEKPVPSGAFG
jgi:hypothetical protein